MAASDGGRAVRCKQATSGILILISDLFFDCPSLLQDPCQSRTELVFGLDANSRKQKRRPVASRFRPRPFASRRLWCTSSVLPSVLYVFIVLHEVMAYRPQSDAQNIRNEALGLQLPLADRPSDEAYWRGLSRSALGLGFRNLLFKAGIAVAD